MEATEASLDIKFTKLRMTIGKTNTVLGTENPEAIERHLSSLRFLTTEINRMRMEVEATKIGKKEEITDIETWNTEIDAQLGKADCEVEKARTWIEERKREAQAIAQEEQLKFHKTKLEMQAEIQTAPHPQQATTPSAGMQAKLPKLEITKFDGSFMDWPRFWGQFSETIDKTSVAAITKFSYLRLNSWTLRRSAQSKHCPSRPKDTIGRRDDPAGEIRKGARDSQGLHERNLGSAYRTERKSEETLRIWRQANILCTSVTDCEETRASEWGGVHDARQLASNPGRSGPHRSRLGEMGPCTTVRSYSSVDKKKSSGHKPTRTRTRTSSETFSTPDQNLPRASRRFETSWVRVLRRRSQTSGMRKDHKTVRSQLS